jgi:hypothetical protein
MRGSFLLQFATQLCTGRKRHTTLIICRYDQTHTFRLLQNRRSLNIELRQLLKSTWSVTKYQVIFKSIIITMRPTSLEQRSEDAGKQSSTRTASLFKILQMRLESASLTASLLFKPRRKLSSKAS